MSATDDPLHRRFDAAMAHLPLVAILRGLRPESAVDIGRALYGAGFRVIEVPLNSPEPLRSIAALRGALPDDAVVGAGTVLSADAVADVPLVLVGEPALCRRYGQALETLQHGAVATLGNTAPDGLWALACAAGLATPSTKERPR